MLRENSIQLQKIIGVDYERKPAPTKMLEEIDGLVAQFKRVYGSTRTNLTLSSEVSLLSGCTWLAELSGSGRLFSNNASTAELKTWVAGILKRKDGLHYVKEADGIDAKPAEDADVGKSSSGSEDDSDDDVPIPRALQMGKAKWIKTHRPMKGESLNDYQDRLLEIMRHGKNGGLLGNVGAVGVQAGAEPGLATLQLAAKEYEGTVSVSEDVLPKVSKILETRVNTDNTTSYLVRWVRGAKRKDEWLLARLLPDPGALLVDYNRRQAVDKGEEFEVKAIHGKRIVAGTVEYLVEWKGCKRRNDYWEPVDNLNHALALIDGYSKNQAGPPNKRSRKDKGGK